MQGQISIGSVKQQEALERPAMKAFTSTKGVESGGELSKACEERKRIRKSLILVTSVTSLDIYLRNKIIQSIIKNKLFPAPQGVTLTNK